MQVGERIKQLRKEAKLTQEELGNLLGVKKVSIQKYENGGIVNLKTETLEKLGNIFKVSPSYIMGWDKFDQNINTNKIKEDIEIIEIIRNRFGYIGVELAHLYDKLNEEGRRRLLFYAEDISCNPKYINK